MHEKISDRLD